ncbi:putative HTH domain antitoxin [Salinibacter ruber]|uniref:UPF0175 family protein n=1 Tax=Salinibacter ruber TaxID=146919 RepID=UPI002169A152|nr:UPF0175 family protein [Salinibacter ruber]MCS4034682.1 putative HTH domain antitoxin [Salinibacter ruber]
MKTLEISYPEDILAESGETPEELEQERRFLVAAKLYEMGRITSGHAAEMAGMDRVPFLNELGRHRISVVNYSPEELTREIEEAKQRAQNE